MWDGKCRLMPELKQKNVVVSSSPEHDLALRDGGLPAPKWFAFTPRQGAATPPERIPGDLPPYGIPRTTQAFIGNRGAYCDYMDIASVRRQDECTVPCSNPCPPFFSPDGADIWVPPEWQTILPVNPNNILDTSLGTKTYRGEILTGRRVKQLAQQEPLIAADITEFSGRPVRHDYCSQTIGWMS